ncbi:MAG: hypothetical protein PUP92_38020 [Rhizonema sp. PD38]|nr:hypothetical protein [Rhizonema sp. PD38]
MNYASLMLVCPFMTPDALLKDVRLGSPLLQHSSRRSQLLNVWQNKCHTLWRLLAATTPC